MHRSTTPWTEPPGNDLAALPAPTKARLVGCAVSALLLAALAGSAAAQAPEELLREEESAAATPDGGPWWERQAATGDWLGWRTELAERGLELFGGHAAEALGNARGGLRTGAVYAGLLSWGAHLDLERLAGWRGGSASTTWLWLSGEDASEELVGNLFTVSNIAGLPSVRLLEGWLQQCLFDDVLSVRIGQITADSEFAVSDAASLFLNSTFGWPGLLAIDVPEASPVYPMGALGARAAVEASEWLGLRSAVFYGGPFAQDGEQRGFRWGLDESAGWLWVSEAQLDWSPGEPSVARPGGARVGFWLHSAAPPADEEADLGDSSGHGFYLVLDQLLVPEPSADAVAPAPASTAEAPGDGTQADEAAQGLSWFARAAFLPGEDSLIGLYVDTGLTYTGLLPTRDTDTLGIAFVYGGLTRDGKAAIADEGFDPAGAEMVIEATYRCRLTPWLSVQPDLQLVLDPGATRDLGTALVAGTRVSVTF